VCGGLTQRVQRCVGFVFWPKVVLLQQCRSPSHGYCGVMCVLSEWLGVEGLCDLLDSTSPSALFLCLMCAAWSVRHCVCGFVTHAVAAWHSLIQLLCQKHAWDLTGWWCTCCTVSDTYRLTTAGLGVQLYALCIVAQQRHAPALKRTCMLMCSSYAARGYSKCCHLPRTCV
jgi:hypothetical protein